MLASPIAQRRQANRVTSPRFFLRKGAPRKRPESTSFAAILIAVYTCHVLIGDRVIIKCGVQVWDGVTLEDREVDPGIRTRL